MAAPDFLPMLRAAKVFRGRRPLGMPDMDDGGVNEMLRRIIPMTSSLKNDDMRRQKEMMEFEASLRQRSQPQPRPTAPVAPMKKNIVYGGVEPPTQLQQKFRQDDIAARSQKDRMATLGATQTGALNNALITGKQRDDADMARTAAEINGRSQVAQMNKEMAAKAADDARKDKDTEAARARLEKGQPIIMKDPKTGMDISVRLNPATNSYERIKIDGDTAGSASRMGVDKPNVNPGQDPATLAAVRKTTQSAIAELDELLDKDGNLRPHTADAVGKSRILGNVSEFAGLGSLTPSTTKGRAGINSLKGKLVLDLIGQMKAQSKTGATGFGAMNQKELAILEASASKLANTDMADDDFRDELKRIRERLNLIMQDQSGGSDADKKADDYMRRKGLM